MQQNNNEKLSTHGYLHWFRHFHCNLASELSQNSLSVCPRHCKTNCNIKIINNLTHVHLDGVWMNSWSFCFQDDGTNWVDKWQSYRKFNFIAYPIWVTQLENVNTSDFTKAGYSLTVLVLWNELFCDRVIIAIDNYYNLFSNYQQYDLCGQRSRSANENPSLVT